MSAFVRRRSLLRLAAAAAAIALIGPALVAMPCGPAAAQQDPAAQLVQRAADQVIQVARTTTGAAREAGMMRVLQADFDLNYMARSTLGTYWNQATPEQRQRFLNVIASAEAHSYSQRFGQYTGQTLTVGRVNPRGNGVSVSNGDLESAMDRPARTCRRKADTRQSTVAVPVVSSIPLSTSAFLVRQRNRGIEARNS